MTKLNRNNRRCSRKLSKKSIKSQKKITIIPWYKTRSRDLKINDLPTEILTQIFSYIPLEDLYTKVRLVCHKWFILAASRTLWQTIRVGPEVSIELLMKWLENAPKLENLKIENRLDAGSILLKVQKHNKNLKNISVHDCWGSDKRMNLPSKPLCNIIVRLPYLNSISLRGSRFISCKFFRLLATRDLILERRKRNIDHNRRSKKIQYYGGALKKQMRMFLQARLQNNRNKLALLSVEAYPRSLTDSAVHEEITVNNEADIERILNTLNFE